jgi:4-cresol dehydrogenase (hydroxylating) flavoprotein subunit
MSRPYPVAEVPQGQIISQETCAKLSAEAGISPWTLAGVIHCPHTMRNAIRQSLRRLLPRWAGRPIFMNRQRVFWGKKLTSYLPLRRGSILQQLDSIESLLDLADGIPRRVALPLAYWLRGDSPSNTGEMDPAKDGCGLIWYSPLVPMKSEAVQAFVEMVRRVCTDHGIEPLITLTSLSDRLFDSTVPILYRPEKEGATAIAQGCYKALCEAGRDFGCVPYRLSTQAMDLLASPQAHSHWTFLHKLKAAIDPSLIIAPGRYDTA